LLTLKGDITRVLACWQWRKRCLKFSVITLPRSFPSNPACFWDTLALLIYSPKTHFTCFVQGSEHSKTAIVTKKVSGTKCLSLLYSMPYSTEYNNYFTVWLSLLSLWVLPQSGLCVIHFCVPYAWYT
jgi:hypothetical protein